MESIQNLESEIRELSKKCDLESVLREELSLEIQTLQRSQAKSSWSMPQQPPETTQVSLQLESGQNENLSSLQSVPSTHCTSTPSTLPAYSLPTSLSGISEATTTSTGVRESTVGPTHSQLSYQPATSVKYSIEGPIVTEVALPRETESSVSSINQSKVDSAPPMETTNTEINRILARIEQDNRILAELEKSRATVDSPLVPSSTECGREEANKERNPAQPAVSLKQSVTRQELEKLMAKLEQDNRILAELDKKRNILESYSTSVASKSSSMLTSNGILGHHGVMPSPSPSLGSLRDPSAVATIQGLTASASSASLHHALVPAGHALIPSALLQRLQSGGLAGEGTLTEEEMLDSIDFIELPGRGRCNIYCARYTYDPLKQSPNENPEAELALNAGDYVIIYGEMDEDGFFNGELLDGRKGLVPSNFVEKLTGEELFEFHATVLYGNRDSDDSSVSFSYAQDMEMTVSDDYLLPEDFHRMNDYIDLEDIEDIDQDNGEDVEKDNENFSRGVPPPQRLILERQMNKSLLIGWVPPDVPPGKIEGYHVYVDGVPKATIKFSERTRALIEGVDSSRPHRVSVRSISSAGYHSKDAACTIVVGKDFPLAPTCVRASHITASSALISWLPSNSNFQHVVAVNSVEVKVVKPGCFRHHVTGLSPNNLYRVSVRVKPGKLLYNDEKNPKKLEMLVSNVEFRTLPKGLPDPPVNVQVEQGPQDGTLLVTWLPVPTNPASTLISPVIGYAVFAAGKKVAEIDGPTGDHALLDGSQLLSLNKKCITVRSKAVDGLSSDSLVCVIPNELLRSMQKSKPRMLCKVESINECDDTQIEEMNKDRLDSQEYPSKPSYTVRRMNQNQPPMPASSQRRQGWKDQSYSSRSVTTMDRNGSEEPRNRREHRNSSGQIVIDPDENLSDKEIYPPSRVNIPSIAAKEGCQSYKITKDSASGEDCEAGFSDDEYDPRRRPGQRAPSPKGYSASSSQQRPLRTEPDAHQSQNSRPHRGPQTQHHHPQQRDRSQPRRQSHDPNMSRNHPPGPSPGRQRPQPPHNTPEPNRRSATRNQPSSHVVPRSNQPPSERDPNHPYYNKRRSSGGNMPESSPQTNRKMPDYHDPRYEDQGNYDSYTSHPTDVGDNRVRFFVALFDYDPQTMSPNPDAADEELPFQEGQMIKIYGDKDPDGFYRGESNGRVGLVPGNMISEVQPDVDPAHYNDNLSRPRTLGHMGMDDRDMDWQGRQPQRIKKMVAIYDYDPQEISPNVDAEVELSFNVGDVIYVIGDVDEDGFYMGELNGVKGLVPSNFLREVPIGEDEEGRHALGTNRPKGQGRSYLGRADCQWNGYTERTTNMVKTHRIPRFMDEEEDMVEVPRNHIIHPAQVTKAFRHLQDTHHLLTYGMRGSMKENLPLEDPMYPLEAKEWPTSQLFQDHYHPISTGKRPTYLALKGSSTSSTRSYDLSTEEQRMKFSPDIVLDHQCGLKPNRKNKGIFSSFKDIFKATKKN